MRSRPTQPRRAQPLRAPRCGFRHRLGRRTVARAGCRGKAGEVVFSGVGKSAAEMRQALEAGIRCFNVESAAELERLAAIAAQMGKVAPIALRVNPDVDPKTHPLHFHRAAQQQFGVAFDEAMTLYRRAATCRGSGQRNRLPYRLATARPRAGCGGRRQDPRPGRPPRGRRHRARSYRSGGGLGIR